MNFDGTKVCGDLTAVELRRLKRNWKGMHERCRDSKHKSFAYYGGRGITVDPAWNDFRVFLKWALENGYQPGLKIDRRDNDADYSPGNCRFVPHVVNCNNTRVNVRIAAYGEIKSQSEWGRDSRSAVSRRTIARRIDKGFASEEAMSQKPYEGIQRLVVAFGESKSVAEWCQDRRCVVPYGALIFRLDNGWNAEAAIITPSGLLRGRKRKARLIEAFGESKSIADWANDPRAKVGKSTIGQRVVAYGWDAERAITTPSNR